ncbi:MAG: DegT/DnrJ/EryC1/StrS family aminotransferase [Deinococcota bacterium]|nr:DegT/DnrJ/EryC1/StrS family aminotransferase [Deinococcota bacterium]
MERLALDGGTPVRTRPFPSWPIFDEREERGLLEVLHSGHWGALSGSKVSTFEQRFAEFQGARFGVCVPNGTLALELALRALGVGPGDEVITTPYTFIATASAAFAVGARPVFADIDPATYNLDPTCVEAAITPRSKVIVPVHLGGHPADMDALRQFAKTHGLRLLEDAAQAWGAAWQDQPVGALGDLGTFSFQSSKNITAGEGGLILTNDPELADVCWSIHNVGRIRTGTWYQHERLGSNLRMTEWQGAILLAQLERLPELMDLREVNARYLAEKLRTVPGLTPLQDDPRVTRHARHLFMVKYDPGAFGGRTRDDFLAAWRAEGITASSAGYVPLHQSPAIQRALSQRGVHELPAYPVAEQAAETTLWLFQYALLDDAEGLDSIVRAAQKIQCAWG